MKIAKFARERLQDLIVGSKLMGKAFGVMVALTFLMGTPYAVGEFYAHEYIGPLLAVIVMLIWLMAISTLFGHMKRKEP